MTDEEDLEKALSDLSEALEQNAKSKRKLSSELSHSVSSHRKNGKVYSDSYGNVPKNSDRCN